MALPSSRMPKELMELEATEKAARVEEQKRKQLVVRFSKTDNFKKSMSEWYKSLSIKEKQRLTPLKLKRRAIYACSIHEIVYDNLPLDWLDEMKAKCGLKLFQRKKRSHEQAFGGSGVSGAPVAGTSNGPLSTDQSHPEKKRSRRLSELKAAKGGDNSTNTTAPQASSSTPSVPAPKKTQTKRFLDLSNDPPPPYWLKCYAEGKLLPRVLTTYSTEDTNILYYDYNPKLQDCFGREVKLTPQPRTNLNYLEGLKFVKEAGEKKAE